MAHDARAVANFLLDYAQAKGQSVTVMALLKIIYFAHGWHLAQSCAPLVRNSFEAWENGPVIRAVYDCFRGNGKSPIDTRATRFDIASGKHEVVEYSFGESERLLLENVFDAYGHFDALKLSDITHEPGSPWDQVWNAPGRRITLGMRISDHTIRSYFLEWRPLALRQ